MARFDDVGEQYFYDDGKPLLYGKIYFYDSGTLTLKTTYSDIDETTPNANPVILDAAGRVPPIYFTGSAKVIVKDQNDVQIGDPKDPITASGSDGGRLAFSSYNALSTYSESDIVTDNDIYYKSLQDNNQGNTPASSPAYWRVVKFIEDSRIVQLFKGADVASAATLTLGDDGNSFDVTGTTGISAIASKGVGTIVHLRFTGILTLTHNATDFDLLTSANITTAAGDEAMFLEYAPGDWRMMDYTRKDGTAVVGGGGAMTFISAATASNDATIDFSLTGGYDEYVIEFLNVIPATDSNYLLLRTSTDSGSTYDSGASDYSYNSIGVSGTAVPQADSSGVAYIPLHSLTAGFEVGNATNENGVSGKIVIIRPGDATYTNIQINTSYAPASGDTFPFLFYGAGRRLSAADVTNIRIYFNTDAISSGLFALYGISRS